MTEFETLVLSKLDRLDQKIDDRFGESNDRLSAHMDDEEGKIETMGDKFVSLQRSVDSYGTKTEQVLGEIQKAFLEHPTEPGKRDFLGHYADHHTRKRWYDRWWGWVEAGIGNLVKVAIASSAAWLIYAVWQHIINGPGGK